MFFKTRIFERLQKKFDNADQGGKLRIWPKLFNAGCKTGDFVPVVGSMGIFSSMHIFYNYRSLDFVYLDGFVSPIIGWCVTEWAHLVEAKQELVETLSRIDPLKFSHPVLASELKNRAADILATRL